MNFSLFLKKINYLAMSIIYKVHYSLNEFWETILYTAI